MYDSPRKILTLWDWIVVLCKGTMGGGLPSVCAYILGIFNEKILSKVQPEELKKYGGLVVALAEFGEKVLTIYLVDERKRKATSQTVETLRTMAKALEDGTVTQDELDRAIQDATATINAWNNISTIVVA